jgi:peptidoglycan/LPS O-acetylase OafA/YrhL
MINGCSRFSCKRQSRKQPTRLEEAERLCAHAVLSCGGNRVRSTSGQYYEKLDHVRAVACYLVFIWHFSHGGNGRPVPFGYAPTVFPLALIDEGHIGVAVFMCLSGYLFAKILNGAAISYGRFIWNRFVRLAPLLAFVSIIDGFQYIHSGWTTFTYIRYWMAGAIVPERWPNNGWSLAIEAHFY